MTEQPVWIAIGSNGAITAHDTQAGAENALRDDDGDVWIECVTLERDTHAPQRPSARSHTAEHATEVTTPEPDPQTAHRRRSWVSPPALTVPGTWHNPWDGGDAA